MLDRQRAFILVRRYLKNEDLIKQSLIAEGILKKIAKILGKDEELWGLTGLLHNLDYEYTNEEPEKRGIFAAQLIEGLVPENCVNAIKSINYTHSDYVPSTSLDKSLIATAAATTFITKIARTTSFRNFDELSLNSMLPKFNDTDFTDVATKSRILLCTDVGIELKEFLRISLDTLKEVFNES